MGIFDKLTRQIRDELTDELDPFRLHVDEARAHIADGRLREAVDALETVLRSRPQHATALYLLGYAHAHLGHHEPARDAFIRAGVVRPGFVEALLGLGESALELGRWEEARNAYREARARAGGRGDYLALVYRGLGRAHLALGDGARGVRELRKALVEEPADLTAATILAEVAPGRDARRLLAGALAKSDDAEWRGRAEAALGRLELTAGNIDAAELMLRKALIDLDADEAGLRVAVLVALAECAHARGRDGEALARLLEAIDLAPRDPVVHRHLARVHEAAGAHDAALAAFEAAAELGDPEARRHAMRLSVRLERWEVVTRHADALGEEDVDARWARTWAAIAAAPDLGGARRWLDASPEMPAARRALADTIRRAVGTPPTDAYGAAQQAVTLARLVPALGDLEPAAAAIVRAHDSPLTVVVMGEFSTGKSTFVNAFLGDQVAPMGARPTTSVIHVMRYGAEPGGRILHADGTTRDVAWEDLAGVLERLRHEDATRIKLVEVRYPNDTLTRVHIVDTPGLNSVLPEHEQVARGFVSEADAVIWLFSASQAGKETEREALAQVRGHGKHVVGVLNKVDQLSPAEATELLAFLRANLGELVEAFVPLSARAALVARKNADAAGVASSGWTTLEGELEERFFRRARTLKLGTARRHLDELLDRMTTRLESARDAAVRERERVQGDIDRARATRHRLLSEMLPAERQAVLRGNVDVITLAAREVLDLVKPRRMPFGSHEATKADRDYILGLLEQELPAVIEPSLERLAAELGGDTARPFEAERARYTAFVRGLLRGGRLDAFFTTVLPKLELQEDAIHHALAASSPDVDDELVVPLTQRSQSLLDERIATLERDAARLDRDRFELDEILLPLIGSLR